MDNTATIDQSVRNKMSVMAWGMAALCAWVLLLAVHNYQAHARAPQYPEVTTQERTVIATPRLP
jgi:hypothetical protein